MLGPSADMCSDAPSHTRIKHTSTLTGTAKAINQLTKRKTSNVQGLKHLRLHHKAPHHKATQPIPLQPFCWEALLCYAGAVRLLR
jgi:hypothetical protein